MTTTDVPTNHDEQLDPLPWRPRGRPDRWATALLAATLAFLTLGYTFGLLAPRIDTATPVDGLVPGSDDLVYAHVVVSNTTLADGGFLPDTQLVDAGRSLPGLQLVSLGIKPGDTTGEQTAVDASSTVEPARVPLRRGDSATVTLVWRVTDCGLVPTDPPAIPLVFRTPLGLTRTVEARAASFALADTDGATYTQETLHELEWEGQGWGRRLARWVCAADATEPEAVP
jgi:hypothetical protein